MYRDNRTTTKKKVIRLLIVFLVMYLFNREKGLKGTLESLVEKVLQEVLGLPLMLQRQHYKYKSKSAIIGVT